MRKRAIYERNFLFRPTISGLCAILPVQNVTYFFLVFPDFGETFCTRERVYVVVYIASFTTVAILWFSRIFLHACLSTFYYFANCWRAKWVSYLELPKTLFFILYFVQMENAHCSGIVDSLNNRCNKYCVKKIFLVWNILFSKKEYSH